MNSSRTKKLLKPQVYFIFYLEVPITKNIILSIEALTHQKESLELELGFSARIYV